MRFITIAIILTSMGLALLYFSMSRRTSEKDVQMPAATKGIIPGEFKITALSGKMTTFQELRGKVVLINFWASWCAPCIREMPSIYKLYAKLKERGFTVVAVSMDDNPVEGISILKRRIGEAPFEIYKGVDEGVFSLFSLEGLPHSALIDRNGKILYSRPGEENWLSEEMRILIEGAL